MNNKKIKHVQTNPFDPDYFSDTEEFPIEQVWNTDNVLAQLIVPRLRAFKALDKHGWCPAFNNMQEWNEAIQKMIDAFELMRHASGKHTPDEDKTIAEGLELFCKHFRDLWD